MGARRSRSSWRERFGDVQNICNRGHKRVQLYTKGISGRGRTTEFVGQSTTPSYTLLQEREPQGVMNRMRNLLGFQDKSEQAGRQNR